MKFFDLLKGEPPPLVGQATRDLSEMLRVGQEMFAAAAANLLENEILDVDLSAMDKQINSREHSLRRAVLEHLTMDPQHELLFSLKLISIVQEAERIGDLAKSIAKTAGLAHKPRLGEPVEPLRLLRDRVLRMFEQAQKSFAEGDESTGRALMQIHEQVKDETTRYLTALASREDITVNEGVVYALAARMLSRVSSHLANITSSVTSPFDHIRSMPPGTGK